MFATMMRRIALLLLCLFCFAYLTAKSIASSSPAKGAMLTQSLPQVGGYGGDVTSPSGITAGGDASGSDTVLPDLFTGTMTYRIPIEVVPGRKGMQPNLALSYGSNKGNGWLGVGWDLEIEAIERRAVRGVNYDIDAYVLFMAGSAIDLIYDDSPGAGFYRAKIEGAFLKVEKKTSYWLVTDKTGRMYRFGYTDDSRQYDPGDPSRGIPADPYKIFKWCLDHVEDTNGNYMDITYIKDQGQIYPDRIDYTGNAGTGPTNYVKFYWESRTDAPDMYSTNFKVTTAKRLITIAVLADGQFPSGTMVRAYKLSYTYSLSTMRSLLISVQQFGKDAQMDGSNTVISGSRLPQITFDWQSNAFNNNLASSELWNRVQLPGPVLPNLPVGSNCFTGHLNGDGKTDFWCYAYNGTSIYFNVALSSASLWTNEQWSLPSTWDPQNHNISILSQQCMVGDLNANGLTDMWCEFPYKSGIWDIALSTGTGFGGSTQMRSLTPRWPLYEKCMTGDLDGDGQTDFWCHTASGSNLWNVALSSGGTTSFQTLGPIANVTVCPKYSIDCSPDSPILESCFTGDLDGDGKTDLWCETDEGSGIYNVGLSTGSGWMTRQWTGIGTINQYTLPWKITPAREQCFTGDLNGDGKTDMWCKTQTPYIWDVALSTGYGWAITQWTGPEVELISNGQPVDTSVGYECFTGDFNGDGKTDFLCQDYPKINLIFPGQRIPFKVALSTGSGWTSRTFYDGPLPLVSSVYSTERCLTGDLNGDGLTDVWCGGDVLSDQWKAFIVDGNGIPDLITAVHNGIGGTSTIAYASSTQYANTQLPFPIKVVSSITTNDGNSVISTSTTTYTYSGGFYHIGQGDFRGFNHVTVTGPVGPQGEQKITDTWFHQGDITSILPETITSDELRIFASAATTGYMKGKPYRTRVTDASGAIYSETLTIYATDADGQAPYFNPPYQVDTYNCDGKISGICAENSAAQHIQTIYHYDQYGNATRADYYGDVNDPTDNRTVTRSYGYNTTSWILGLPTVETVYEGIGTINRKAEAYFYYDGTTDCTVASTNQIPDKGNLTKIERWHDDGLNPVTLMAYDDYGNLTCTRDPKGNPPSQIIYDGTNTLPTEVRSYLTSTIYLSTTTQYYSGISSDKGLYGQVKSKTDPNNQTTTMEYDKFGRKTKVIAADTSWSSWTYPVLSDYGSVGTQNITMDNSENLTSWTYFDGLGRTIRQEKDGPPDGNTIVTKTEYNATGTVLRTSVPCFSCDDDTRRYTRYTYDPLGRVLQITRPDDTKVESCYNNGITVNIDANDHQKRETKDVMGRLVKVEEYKGTYSICSTGSGSVYATTTYQYDVLGNLRFVTDTKGNQTEMQYDSLGHKIFMHDPDMGDWTYEYDMNGNLWMQKDAKGQTDGKAIFFTYDALNRVTFKDYSLGTHIVSYIYDETWSPNSRGRLTTTTDASGSEKYSYDQLGRIIQMNKNVDTVNVAIQYQYDGLGRLHYLIYPGNDVVKYTYDTGGNLYQVLNNADSTAYATYTEYTALGQPGTVTFKNGVTTSYTYYSENNRLDTIYSRNTGTTLLKLSYGYDNIGNITSIIDNTPRTVQPPHYDEVASYDYGINGVKPHAVTRNLISGTTSTDDLIGTMTADGLRTIAYNYDTMPTTITIGSNTVNFVYDGKGSRVMKADSSGTTVYIGKLYECRVGGACSKYIFAGNTRIAIKLGTSTIDYYHPDHLGSTSAMSDVTGNITGNIQYLPFGETRSGSVPATHKFTSQELDAETGLYNYNARLYNPALGRFISADTIVPDPSNPQSLNRYSYVLNNPLYYIDPTGHYNPGFDTSLDNYDFGDVYIGNGGTNYGGYGGYGNSGYTLPTYGGSTSGYGGSNSGISLPSYYGQNGVGIPSTSIYGQYGGSYSFGNYNFSGTLTWERVGQMFIDSIKNMPETVWRDINQAATDIWNFPKEHPKAFLLLAIGAPEMGAGIETRYGLAIQSMSKEALSARFGVEEGATLYRGGILGRSAGPEGQFWALENPLTTIGYARSYGIPAGNANFNFIETGTLVRGSSFITRQAPGGTAIEVVVNPFSVTLDSFVMP